MLYVSNVNDVKRHQNQKIYSALQKTAIYEYVGKERKICFFSLQTWNIEIVTEYAEHIWMLAEKNEE